jgi:peptidoglycan/LPS O-acetylase OafA/YrhL
MNAFVPRNVAHRFAHIDAMRAFAVALVLIEHAGFAKVPGDAGVTVFFTISGFIITYVLLRERDRTDGFAVGGFYARRILKLGPPFLVAILVPTLIYALSHRMSWLAVGSQVLFSYNWLEVYDTAASVQVLPGSDVVWSLAVEEQFYIVFAVVWLLIVGRARWRQVLAVLCVITIVVAVSLRLWLMISGQYEFGRERLLRATDTRMDAIAWGVLAALAFHFCQASGAKWLDRFSRNATLVVACAAFVAVVLIPSTWIGLRMVVQPLCAVAVILWGLLPNGTWFEDRVYRILSWRWVQFIGLASYSLYIAHGVVMMLLRQNVFDRWPLMLRGPLLLICGGAAGILLYVAVEIPVQKWRRLKNLSAEIETSSKSTPPDIAAAAEREPTASGSSAVRAD